MDQELRLPEPTEPVTEAEVRALLERFGERQTVAPEQSTIRDVAEALQVEPTTVGTMLVELRRSKDQHEIRARLDMLEEQNAELRQRAEGQSGQLGSALKPTGDHTVRTAILAALCLLIVITLVGGMAGERQWGLGAVPIVFALIALNRFRRK